MCARTLGEACGGPGGFSGTCEPPLQCVAQLPLVDGLGVCMGKYLQQLRITISSKHNIPEIDPWIFNERGRDIRHKGFCIFL